MSFPLPKGITFWLEILRGNLLCCLLDHDAGNLSSRFVPEIRNPRIVHGVSASHGEGLHQRDVASRVIELTIGIRHGTYQPFSRNIGVTPKSL